MLCTSNSYSKFTFFITTVQEVNYLLFNSPIYILFWLEVSIVTTLIVCQSVTRSLAAANNLFLEKGNREKMPRYAKLHNNWTAKSVETVLMERWINFECFDVSHYQYVQRRSGERDYSGCLNPSVKHGGGTVIVWGYISVCGVVDLLKTHEIMNSDQNLTLLFYLESIWLAADLFFSMTMITNTPSMQ